MIKFVTGNLLESEAEALVNTVNTVGIMGKGIALQFRQAFPENYEKYRKACQQNVVQPGKMFVVPTGRMITPRFIINFPTKRHWKDKSRIDDIEKGLEDLVRVVKELDIRTVAIPPLGCGNGGLKWTEVRPRIEVAFKDMPGVELLLYEPV
jgi:O-acetyl-ADP-ribose deacetylase (regulator of RNase III)